MIYMLRRREYNHIKCSVKNQRRQKKDWKTKRKKEKKETKNSITRKKTVINMLYTHPNTSIITWNDNGLNNLIKNRWPNGLENKKKLYVVHKKPTFTIKTHKLKVKEWRKMYHVNTKQKESWRSYINYKQQILE